MDKDLLEKALKMSPNESVVLAELILSSIDHEEDEIRELWLSEVKDRIRAVNEDKAKLLDFESLYNED